MGGQKIILLGGPLHFPQLFLVRSNKMYIRPRLHGSARIWDRSEIRPFSPV